LNLELREILRLSEAVLVEGPQAVDPEFHMTNRDLLEYHYSAAVEACRELQMLPQAGLLAECQALTAATLTSQAQSAGSEAVSVGQDTVERLRRTFSQIMNTVALRGFPNTARHERRARTLVS